MSAKTSHSEIKIAQPFPQSCPFLAAARAASEIFGKANGKECASVTEQQQEWESTDFF